MSVVVCARWEDWPWLTISSAPSIFSELELSSISGQCFVLHTVIYPGVVMTDA